MSTVRVATPQDLPAILRVTEEAFGGPVEPELVRLLHASPTFVPELSLVAVEDGVIVGHVMLSYVELLDGPQTHRVLSLSPLSVLPREQMRGIGASLVRDALRRADDRGEPLVILEGSPDYYGRLGFEDARPHGIVFSLPDWAPANAGQVVRLTAYDPRVRGDVAYPPAFREAEASAEQLERSNGSP